MRFRAGGIQDLRIRLGQGLPDLDADGRVLDLLAEEDRRCVGTFHSASLHPIGQTGRGNQFAGPVHTNLEGTPGGGADPFGDLFRSRIDGV